MPKKKVEVYNKDQLIYPYIESDHVTFSNGMKVSEMLDQSISMPKVIHEDLSFKVGVGDQDVSSAIVDSSVAEMTIKGKTYQNILPEPSTHVLTNNKEMFKVNEGLDPNVEIVDGVSKSAILSGNTLVNYFPEYTKTMAIGTGGWRTIFNSKLNISLTPNTPYIFVNNSNIGVKLNVSIKGETTAETNVIRDLTTNIVKFTTPNNSENFTRMIIYLMEDNTSELIYDSFMVIPYQDGMENWDIPYFTGMQSVKMPVLTTTGKNLLDINHFSKLENWDGKTTSERPYYAYEIKLKPNTSYTFSRKENSTGNNVYFCISKKRGVYDWYGGIIHPTDASAINQQKTITTDSTGILYFNLYQARNELANLIPLLEDAQLEEGSVATSYEPYKSNILSCQLAPLNQSMFEQGSFSESTPANTQPYENIKLNSGSFYNNRIRTKGTYKVVKGATYSGQLNNGYGIFICYCKNGLYSAKDKGWINETNFTFTVPNDCDEMFFALKKTDNSAITPSDYSRIGLKIHQEVALRSLPNGIKDTLNLNTGEYVQHIVEIVLDGSETWNQEGQRYWTPLGGHIVGNTGKTDNNVLSNKYVFVPVGVLSGTDITIGQCRWGVDQNFMVNQDNGSMGVASWKTYLSQNPLIIQCQLATPIVKTVDLSSSGNWEKIVLDGSENWLMTNNTNFYTKLSNELSPNALLPIIDNSLFTPKDNTDSTANAVWYGGNIGAKNGNIIFNILDKTLEQFKQYLSQNPITVWYPTQSHKDFTQVKQPIFFKDGHIQLSSGADNSLIPTLDYQAKTSNSYVMDLMKANTRYTMKAKSASGTFTIDGTSYGAGTNGTFTTPSSMTNKLLVMSNKTNEEVMILEGDVVSKTIPYFKGIKSAFEDEDKIEVLSTGKNLYDGSFRKGNIDSQGNAVYNESSKNVLSDFILAKPNMTYTMSNHGVANKTIFYCQYDSNKQYVGAKAGWETKTLDSNVHYIRIQLNDTTKTIEELNNEFMLEESSTQTSYEPYKSNSTKIPLLSPLRSLPNGVKDEVILDRENHKAKIIQRVGKAVLNGSEVISLDYPHVYNDTIAFKVGNTSLPNKDNGGIISDTLKGVDGDGYWLKDEENIMTANLNNFKGRILRSKLTLQNAEGVKRHLQQNPLTVYYELATPVITEVDLGGFPYIYKDGHIFLNSEIVPTTEIIYSVNQCQQISASNEDIIRHEKELTYLQKLIAQYVQVDYESALLSLKV